MISKHIQTLPYIQSALFIAFWKIFQALSVPTPDYLALQSAYRMRYRIIQPHELSNTAAYRDQRNWISVNHYWKTHLNKSRPIHMESWI